MCGILNGCCALLALVALAACGGGGQTATAPEGSWRLVAESGEPPTAPQALLDGSLVITTDEYALGIARPAASGIITSFTLSADGKALVLGGSTTVPFQLASGQLTLQIDAQRSFTFAPATATRLEAFPVTGTVSIAPGAPAVAMPRAALVFLSRTEPGFVNDVRDDKPLTFSAGTASFDISRTDAARGTDRITYGTTAGISLAFVVVYDDRDGSGTLDDLFTPCSEATVDCIRGVSSLVLGYRDGESAELAASPYAFLRPGWTTAVQVTDRRTGTDRLGLVPTDPQQTLPFDVTVEVDPTKVVVPALGLEP